jgi:ribosomal protein L4
MTDVQRNRNSRIRELLKQFDLVDKKVTIQTANLDNNLFLACRNFYNVLVLEAESGFTL